MLMVLYVIICLLLVSTFKTKKLGTLNCGKVYFLTSTKHIDVAHLTVIKMEAGRICKKGCASRLYDLK